MVLLAPRVNVSQSLARPVYSKKSLAARAGHWSAVLFFVVMVVARVAVVVVLVCRAPSVAWGLFWPVLGRFGGPNGTLWGPLGALLGLPGALLGRLGSEQAKKEGGCN